MVRESEISMEWCTGPQNVNVIERDNKAEEQ